MRILTQRWLNASETHTHTTTVKFSAIMIMHTKRNAFASTVSVECLWKMFRHKRDKADESSNEVWVWLFQSMNDAQASDPFDCITILASLSSLNARFGCVATKMRVHGDPLIICITMHKSCVVWLNFRSHCYTGIICIHATMFGSMRSIVVCRNLCIELFAHDKAWVSGSGIASTKRCDPTKCVLAHIDWKVNCIFEIHISLVHIENFVSSALHTPDNYENRCERCLWLLLCEKCCVPWCRQFILCILFAWTRFFAQCHLD